MMKTADGNVLEYLEVGDPQGQPVVYLHGTPGTAGSAVLYGDAADQLGVRLVAVSRPGYGESSTTAPGLLSVGHDIGALATGLGIETFSVLGVSGGGPFALAVGAAIGPRIRSILVAAGPAPIREVAPDMLGPEDLEALDLLAAGEVDRAVAVVTDGVRRDFGPMVGLPLGEFEAAFRAMVPAEERYFDSRPEERATFFADLHRAFDRYDGFVRDNLSWCGPWDFRLGDVAAPVRLSYGDADSMGPLAHGEWLHGQLESSQLTVHPGAGHGDVTFGLAEWSLSVMKES
jgi:pimeloyl-ACP methyl ester carboxylesterase